MMNERSVTSRGAHTSLAYDGDKVFGRLVRVKYSSVLINNPPSNAVLDLTVKYLFSHSRQANSVRRFIVP